MARPTTTGRRLRRRKEITTSSVVAEHPLTMEPAAISLPPPEMGTVAVPQGLPSRWPWYFLSAFIPFAGVVVGLFLYEHESVGVRRIGRNSLLIGFVVWVLFPMALFLLLSLLTAVAAMDWIANLFPPGN
jgi:hypothetical protein